MIKYISTAAALKCFSSAPLTRSLYRKLGNRLGNSRRSKGVMPSYYPERLKWVLRLQRQHHIVKNGDRILELGTGWLHWEALTLRLFYDIEAVLFDVWDNRQLGGLKNYVRQLAPMLNNGFHLTEAETRRARSLSNEILATESFESLYIFLCLKYFVEIFCSLCQF
jgi:hypothetical protein